MRLVHVDLENGEVKAEPETLEDLWTLSRVLEAGDVVEGRSFRRFKTPGLERGESGEKKPVRLALRVVNVEFAENANKLRVTGVILKGEPQEFAPAGEHHTLDVEPHARLVMRKKFLAFHLALLREAEKAATHAEALLVAMDEEKATFAVLRKRGVEFAFEVRCTASKRDPATFDEGVKRYYADVLAAIARSDAPRVVVAGPGFAKDAFQKYARDRNPGVLKKTSFAYASSAERSAIHELLKQGVLEQLLGEQKLAQEFAALEEFQKHVAKEDGLAAYGAGDVRKALDVGAVETLLISDAFLRAKETRDEANALLEQGRKTGARLVLFNSEDDAGRQFAHYAVAALLRFRVAWG